MVRDSREGSVLPRTTTSGSDGAARGQGHDDARMHVWLQRRLMMMVGQTQFSGVGKRYEARSSSAGMYVTELDGGFLMKLKLIGSRSRAIIVLSFLMREA